MRAADIQGRIARLEASRSRLAGSRLIISFCPLPDAAPSSEAVDGWLAEGLATIFGNLVFYDGGEKEPLNEQQWCSRYCRTEH